MSFLPKYIVSPNKTGASLAPNIMVLSACYYHYGIMNNFCENNLSPFCLIHPFKIFLAVGPFHFLYRLLSLSPSTGIQPGVLYHWAIPSPFWDWVLLNYQSWPQTCFLPASTSQVANITGVHASPHHLWVAFASYINSYCFFNL